ncbi:hypothetical protein [Ochrobactrum soli]|uniref:Uncharacterized protein n=1 Tax=Ochrobactrum soli TaxID=2448455 RepID=A0A2P9HET0_9HYPH|nr:hypothetical protein [[Ochrobactrum] soli]SPL62603.1 hypothetical protein OHAE_5210 [[Ochrobactrum] soli]
MTGNPDFHKSGKLHSLLAEGEEAATTPASAPEHVDWLDSMPIIQFAAIALACGFGTVVLISRMI